MAKAHSYVTEQKHLWGLWVAALILACTSQSSAWHTIHARTAAVSNSLLQYVGSEYLTRQIWLNKQSLHTVNENFFASFNLANTSKAALQHTANQHTHTLAGYVSQEKRFLMYLLNGNAGKAQIA